MAEVDGPRRRMATSASVVGVWAANHESGAWFYLEPGEELELRDDEPSVVRVEVLADV